MTEWAEPSDVVGPGSKGLLAPDGAGPDPSGEWSKACGTGLIRQPDRSAWPWGWGALQVDSPPSDWVCPHCGRKTGRRKTGRHTYLFGEPRCTDCARAWCKANWPGPRAYQKQGDAWVEVPPFAANPEDHPARTRHQKRLSQMLWPDGSQMAWPDHPIGEVLARECWMAHYRCRLF